MTSHHALYHVSDSNLIAYVHHQLTDAQREEIDRHLETCLECRRQLLSHADVQRRLSDGLGHELAQLHPISNWATIQSQIHNLPSSDAGE